MSPPSDISVNSCDNLSVSGESVNSDISDIGQLDGNVSVGSTNVKTDKFTAALNLPTVATYNLRSLMPKIDSLKTDFFERKIDVGFLTEIWEQEQNSDHRFEIEKLLETRNKKGVSFGGAAIVVNLNKFTCEKLKIHTPSSLEVVWGLLRPKNPGDKFKKIIVRSFYSPPEKRDAIPRWLTTL